MKECLIDFDAWFWHLILTLDFDAWFWCLILTLDFDWKGITNKRTNEWTNTRTDIADSRVASRLKSNRKNLSQTWGWWQIMLWTGAKQTSLSVYSKKLSLLRKMLSKYWNCYRKICWQIKNIWRTLEDVKSNSGQLLFSSPNWFFHSHWS